MKNQTFNPYLKRQTNYKQFFGLSFKLHVQSRRQMDFALIEAAIVRYPPLFLNFTPILRL